MGFGFNPLKTDIKLNYIRSLNLVLIIRTVTFYIKKLYVLPIQCIFVFCVYPRASSDYFAVQHEPKTSVFTTRYEISI